MSMIDSISQPDVIQMRHV